MARTPKEVTDAELSVLELLWERGDGTVRVLAEALYPEGGNSKTATVQKLCERLEAKGCVRRDRSVRPTTFAANVARHELVGRRLKGIADTLCAGSYTPLLTQLVEAADLSPQDIQRLREYVDQLDAASSAEERS